MHLNAPILKKMFFFSKLWPSKTRTQRGAGKTMNPEYRIQYPEGGRKTILTNSRPARISRGERDRKSPRCRVAGEPHGCRGFSGGAEPDTRGACAPRYSERRLCEIEAGDFEGDEIGRAHV